MIEAIFFVSFLFQWQNPLNKKRRNSYSEIASKALKASIEAICEKTMHMVCRLKLGLQPALASSALTVSQPKRIRIAEHLH